MKIEAEYPSKMLPRPGEIGWKEWLSRMGKAKGLSGHGYYMRIRRGLEPMPKIRQPGTKTIYVIP